MFEDCGVWDPGPATELIMCGWKTGSMLLDTTVVPKW